MISAVLSCEMDGRPYVIVMDTVEKDTVTTSIEVTSQPLMSGDFIADHLFKQPIDYSISGTFGMGKKQGIVVNDGGMSLTEVQSLFEKIKNNGIVCDLVRVSVDDSGTRTPRFLRRTNMILQSITWTEEINTLGFDFSFKEVAFAKSIEYNVNTDDAYMPNVEELVQRSFSETLLNRQDVLGGILQFMHDNDIMGDDFWKGLLGTKSETFLALGIGVAVAYALGSLIVACGASGPIGWLVGAIVVAVTMIVVGIVKLVRMCRFKIKPFDKYNKKELERWSKLMEAIADECEEMTNAIQVFQPQSDKDQEDILTINGEVFVYQFTTNNTNDEHYRELVIINGKNEKVGGINNLSSAPRNFGDCNSILTSADGNCIYKNEANKLWCNIVYVGEETPEEQQKLTNYLLTMSSINPDDFNKMMAQIIKDYLLR